jgi:cardiolipin synthase
VPIVRMASRSFYPGLLYAGVRLFEYQGAMLHAKAVIFDDDLVLIGSANMDNRSFRLNFEASCFLGGREINESLAGVFMRDLAACREIDLAEVENRPWRTQVIDAAAHLLSPFL